MPSAVGPLRVAVIAALQADSVLSSQVNGVFDSVPPGVSRPYVTVGSMFETEADAHNSVGRDATVPLHIWSDHEGTKETSLVLSSVIDVLNRRPLEVSGWTHVSVAYESATEVADPDPSIRHTAATFRVWLTKE